MKTLELKHIIGYLPYGLECEILNFRSDYVGERYGKIIGYYMLMDKPHYVFKNGCAGKDSSLIRPFLRPLSDLTRKELEEQGFDSYIDWLTIENKNPLEVPYKMVEYLFSKHFDVYGLIEQGLAIDINTLEK